MASALASRSDRQLAESLRQARELGSGIGGTSALLDVGGVPVFAKRVPLTDVERQADNVMSTANLFGLPPFCQYGVGSPSFGAFDLSARESGFLAATRRMTPVTR
ncbi:hypothetical protein ACIBO2_33955 [Nonomuraea sp. NPDC050022]|uniref:hypothetical protein n=1 Tax=Nonomuraea sp. NPDC050022 TaxID=3364358 RepID=UPI0037B0C20E